ncbi:MAG: hypothetical protein DRJ52_00370 [Thermoprotei archaeon]|nr:MAG: hypothetical protein DRJ52_00370 [Thermoprotei archaeon]RLF00295.1 MAG: hypothetical protein DRJ63_02865 [Thermoprotei archaeon]HDI74946.1 SIS domain-containing protein [Thermoprotei archaeon]
MYKEIYEGPKAIVKTLESEKENAKRIAEDIEKQAFKAIHIIGSGTSFHASLILQYFLSRLSKVNSVAIPASEYILWNPEPERYAVVAFSQSGESGDIIEAINKLNREKAKVYGITNTPGSTLTKISDFSLVTRAGEEKAVTATKTFDVQIASALMVSAGIREELSSKIDKLADVAKDLEKILPELDKSAEEIDEKLKDASDIYILGTGSCYPIALEAGLKFKEAACIHAEAFALREFLHGPVQLVDESTPVIMILQSKIAKERAEKVVKKLKAYNPPIVVVHDKEVSVDFAEITIPLPIAEEIYAPLYVVKAVQLLSYHTSIARGLDPDKPTKLTKVVK